MPEKKPQYLVSEDHYLRDEMYSDARHDYVAGLTFKLQEGSLRHNQIAMNLATLLNSRLHSADCQVHMFDTRVHVPYKRAYYYPDVMINCRHLELGYRFEEAPCLIAEIVSPETACVDRREKLLAYQTLPTLQVYLLVNEDVPSIKIYQRADNHVWWEEQAQQIETLRIDYLELNLPVTAVYDDLILVNA